MRMLFLSLIFPNSYQPTLGIFNRKLLEALAKKHDIRVIAPIPWVEEWKARPNGRPKLDRQTSVHGLQIHHPRYLYTPKVLRSHYGKFYWRSIQQTVKNVLVGFRPDVVMAYWTHPDGEVALRLTRRLEVPSAVIVGGTDVRDIAKGRSRRRRIQKVLQNADAVITVSQELKDRVGEFGVWHDKIHVLTQGIDAGLFTPDERNESRQRLGIPSDQNVLLWVGRMVPVKGLDVLVKSCSLLKEHSVPFHLYLVGDGPMRNTLQTDIESRGLSSLVTFVGSQMYEQLPAWYRVADLTVLPSRSEGLPNVLRESLACGTRFVASRVGGIHEIANPRWDRLVSPESPKALADAIQAAIQDRPSSQAPFVKVTSWEDSASRVEEILLPLVNERRKTMENGSQLLTPYPRSSWRQTVKKVLAATMPRGRFLVKGPSKSSSVCLTFDDGPDPDHTPAILEVLKRFSIPATFFVIGQKAERHPELVRRMDAEGHIVANHTYSHADPDQTSAPELLIEVGRTREILKRLLGKTPTFFRPPKGKLTARKLWGLWRAGQTVVLWNADPRDYVCSSSEQVRVWFQHRPLRGGDVVLMHDNRPHAAKVLPELIAEAKGRGLGFIPLSDLGSG
jgi:peptidoglycan/xylan/chitin deacetylase (PgdA/CDA1 family)/glycosyltransferase involved in cell wall biosynthesis